MEIDIEEKLLRLNECARIRNIAAQTCFETLQKILTCQKKVSEFQFANRWNKKLQNAYPKGFVGCWYDPPPNGMAVLFTSDKNPVRINYSTLRPENYWPNPKIYFDKEGLGYLFASPFTFINDVPIIGDFGVTYYLGKNTKIIAHFKKCKELLDEILDKVTVGMTYKELYVMAETLFDKYSLYNNIHSATDKDKINLGHCIPFIERNLDAKEMKMIQTRDMYKVNSVISHARIFINKDENHTVNPNCAFTFEPRLTVVGNSNIPMCSFHCIVQFIEGEKNMLTNFRGIFNLLGMQWLDN